MTTNDTTTAVKTKKSANRKFNQETIEKRNASRNLKFDFKVDSDIPMPAPSHRSKYNFESLKVPMKDSFFWPASKSLATSIKNSARLKFNRILVALPRTEEHEGKVVDGHRFWLRGFVNPALEAGNDAPAEAGEDDAAEDAKDDTTANADQQAA